MPSEGVQVILAVFAWKVLNCGRPSPRPAGSNTAAATVGRSPTSVVGSTTAMSMSPSSMRQSGNRLISFWMLAVLPTMHDAVKFVDFAVMLDDEVRHLRLRGGEG